MAREVRRLAGDPVMLVLIVAIFAALALFVVFPLVKVLLTSVHDEGRWTLSQYLAIGERRLYRNALVNSVAVAVSTGVLSVVLGYLLAFVVTRTDIPLKRSLHLTAMLPIISPPFVTAVSILFLFGFLGLISHGVLALTDLSLSGFRGVVLSQVFTFAPIAYLSVPRITPSTIYVGGNSPSANGVLPNDRPATLSGSAKHRHPLSRRRSKAPP